MKGLLVALACACPLALHAAVLHGNPWLVALISAAIAANFVLLAARKALPWWLIAAAGIAALAAGLMDRQIAARLAFLPPILINFPRQGISQSKRYEISSAFLLPMRQSAGVNARRARFVERCEW